MATAASKKAAPVKRTVADTAAKKTVAKKTVAKKAVAKKAAEKTATAKKAPVKKSASTATSTGTTRTTARRTASAGRSSASTTPATTKPEKKVAVKSNEATTAGPTAAKKSSSAPKTAPKTTSKAEKLTVREGESPWTTAELAELRGELEREAEHLREEIRDAENAIVGLLRDGGDGAGNDQADVGSTTFERDHEMSLANNARDMLMQTERALTRIDDGSYGVCESCGNAIGKGRLQAFPRATLCVSCKEREERR